MIIITCNELLRSVIKTFVLVIWRLVSLYATHPDPLLLQPVSFSLTQNHYTLDRNQYHTYIIFKVVQYTYGSSKITDNSMVYQLTYPV